MPPHLCTAEQPILKTRNHYLLIDFLFFLRHCGPLITAKLCVPSLNTKHELHVHIYIKYKT
jgi:hypothetical protein